MAQHGKKYRKALEGVDRTKRYGLDEAVALVKSLSYAKYDEAVEMSVRLGIDAKKTDQLVRGSVVLPHGLGKQVRVLVFAKGDKANEARDAGADSYGGDELVEKIQGGWMDFDKVIATPDMMGQVGRLGKVLGPRGLMPNPKLGTVTFDVARRSRRSRPVAPSTARRSPGIVQAAVGRKSFEVAAAAREHPRVDGQHPQGQAGHEQGALPQERHHLDDHRARGEARRGQFGAS